MANLIIDFLDVGQGDGIFIQFPDSTQYSNSGFPLDGTTMMVDLGSLKNRTVTTKDILDYFRNHTRFGVSEGQTLDWLILTHGDADHYNRVKHFYDAFKPKITNLLFSGRKSDYGSNNLIDYLVNQHKKKKYTPINIVSAPDWYPAYIFNSDSAPGGVETFISAMNILPFGDDGHTKNANSIVTHLVYGGNQIILSGDATRETEAAILSTADWYADNQEDAPDLVECTLLKVGHHGSTRTSILPAWAEGTNPLFLVVSSDRHGVMDFDQDETTGYRLPTELCFSIFRENANLANTDIEHSYVSSYDRGDYEAFNSKASMDDDIDEIDDPYPKSPRIEWKEIKTREGIYTTLAKMDAVKVNNKWADVGQHLQAHFFEDGSMNMYSSLDTESGNHQVSAKPAS